MSQEEEQAQKQAEEQSRLAQEQAKAAQDQANKQVGQAKKTAIIQTIIGIGMSAVTMIATTFFRKDR